MALGLTSASKRDEYQGCFLGGKGGRCVGLTTLPPSCADCLKSGSLNLLETPGLVEACKGIALPFTFSTMSTGIVVRRPAMGRERIDTGFVCVISVRKEYCAHFQHLCFVCWMSSFCSRSYVPQLLLSVNEVIGLCRSGPVPFTLCCTLPFRDAFHLVCGGE
jgi:hypothetical protein